MKDQTRTNQKPIDENAFLKQRIQELEKSEAEHKLTDGELLLANQKLKLHFEQTPMVVIEWDLDFRVTRWNPAAQTIFGFSPEEAIGQQASFIVPEAFRPHVDQVWQALLKTGGGKRSTNRNVRKDGMTILCEWYNTPLVDERGTVTGVASLVQDITERNQAEEALHVSEENYRRSLDESPQGIRIVSKEGETLYANRATLDIFGYDSIKEWQTTQAVKRYTEQSYAEFKVRREKRRLGENDSSEYGIDIVRKDGEVRHLYVWRTRVLWNGKEHYQLRYSDITDSKRSEKQLQETLDSLRRAIGATIQVMVSAVETRDPYTSGHQTRTADLARAIAMEMKLPQDKIDGIRMTGSIHDIGKLSIPAEILSKPTKLSDIEFSLIKEHARKGFEMLKDVESPWPLAEIVYQHHERMDGSGYPRNLKGEEILIEAQILAVADVVEAMASHRPYRPGLGIDVALSEIEKNRGILYDDTVTDACLRLFRKKGFKLEGIGY